jgi:hypothetical protein
MTTGPTIEHLGFTDDPGRDAAPELRARILRDFSPIDGLGEVGETTAIRVFRLPFHEEVEMIVATDPGWRPSGVRVVWLVETGRFYRLNGSSPPIHALNEKARPRLGPSTVLPYLRFFSFFVRGHGGPFLIVDSVAHPLLPEANRREIGDRIVPPEVLGQDASDAWHVAGVVHYGTALTAARFGVAPSGMVEMLGDARIVEDLPAAVDAPLCLVDDGREP